MLLSANQFNSFFLVARDGELGTVDDVFFDDETWTIRHIVVDTGGWLAGRQVLVSPHAVDRIDRNDSSLHVNLTKQQVESSPDIDTAKPVSRQYEMALYKHYGYPYYWTGPLVWGATAFPGFVNLPAPDDGTGPDAAQRVQEIAQADPHLRSCMEVAGYSIQTIDGELGHVEDFLFDDANWSIQGIGVDPRNWWPGKHVLVSPARIEKVDWAARRVVVNLTRAEIEHSPDYDPENLSASAAQLEALRGPIHPNSRG